MTRTPRLALFSMLLVASTAIAQDKPEKPQAIGTPLKLQIVYSRYQGEKKVSSVPHTLSVNADEGPTRLRMGVQVPITTQTKDGMATSYRDVGNNIDCRARTISDGRFRLECSFEQSSLYAADSERRGSSSDAMQVGTPVIRNFRSEANITLRDGQTAQHTSATDPVSGEVLKIDITLNVVR